MAAIFGEGKIFGKLQRLHSLDPLEVRKFCRNRLSRTVKEIEANLCFAKRWPNTPQNIQIRHKDIP